MSEKEFTREVLRLATLFGWRAVHFPTSQGKRGEFRTTYMGDGKGFPDIVAVRERLLFAELKIPPNRPTPEQIMWSTALTRAGVEQYLWTPDDLDSIAKTFSGSAPPSNLSL